MGSPLRDLDASKLQILVDQSAAEDSFLDFKELFDVGRNSAPELAKDVCAFANAQGGLLLFGIREFNGRASGLVPFPPVAGELRDRVAQILRSHTRPSPAFDLSVIEAADEGKVFVAIAVPRSADSPHAVIRSEKSDPWLQFPVRYESTTRFMDEAELSTRYATRHSLSSDRIDRLRGIVDGSPTLPSHVTLSLAMVPLNQGQFAISDRSADGWISTLHAAIDLADGTLGLPLPFSPSGTRYVPGAIRILHDLGAIELHSDGSYLASCHLDPFVTMTPGQTSNRPAGLLDQQLVSLCSFLLLFGARFQVTGAGCYGDVYVSATLTALDQSGTERSIALVSAGSSTDREQWRMSASTTSRAKAETYAQLESLIDSESFLIRALYRLSAPLVQHFGLPGPSMITEAGALVVDEFASTDRDQVLAWAAERSLDCLS